MAAHLLCLQLVPEDLVGGARRCLARWQRDSGCCCCCGRLLRAGTRGPPACATLARRWWRRGRSPPGGPLCAWRWWRWWRRSRPPAVLSPPKRWRRWRWGSRPPARRTCSSSLGGGRWRRGRRRLYTWCWGRQGRPLRPLWPFRTHCRSSMPCQMAFTEASGQPGCKMIGTKFTPVEFAKNECQKAERMFCCLSTAFFHLRALVEVGAVWEALCAQELGRLCWQPGFAIVGWRTPHRAL